MDIGHAAERLMGMDEAAWRRHANPWSGWTRVALGPLLFWAIWSHLAIGWWALVPCGVLALLAWINPRAFPPPRDPDNWMSKGTFGERLWLQRRQRPIPARHARMANILNSFMGALLLAALIGFWRQEFWLAFFAWHGAMALKLWFVDRMVWLYEDMAVQDPEIAAWARPGERS